MGYKDFTFNELQNFLKDKYMTKKQRKEVENVLAERSDLKLKKREGLGLF